MNTWQKGMYGKLRLGPMAQQEIFRVVKAKPNQLFVEYYWPMYEGFFREDKMREVLPDEAEVVTTEQVASLGIALPRRRNIFAFLVNVSCALVAASFVAIVLVGIMNDASLRKPVIAEEGEILVRVQIGGDPSCTQQSKDLRELSKAEATEIIHATTSKTPASWYSTDQIDSGFSVVDGTGPDASKNQPFCPTVWLNVHTYKGQFGRVYCELRTLEGYRNFETPLLDECPITPGSD